MIGYGDTMFARLDASGNITYSTYLGGPNIANGDTNRRASHTCLASARHKLWTGARDSEHAAGPHRGWDFFRNGRDSGRLPLGGHQQRALDYDELHKPPIRARIRCRKQN
jgi:hypothetical protein